jgi:trans-aconitate 2-methyltransferase
VSGAMNTGAREWDAKTYDRVSDPQFNWGVEVLERLELDGDEHAIDAGCGSGRVTELLVERLPEGRVLALDASQGMIDQARERLGDSVDYAVMDLQKLAVDEPADLVFSTAVFHWIPDHDNLFRRVFESLKPGGRLHAQCGGEGNVARHRAAAFAVGSREPYAEHLVDLDMDLWNFQNDTATAERLEAIGFTEVETSLEPKPAQPAEPAEFMRTVTLGPVLALLPDELRDPFVESVVEEMEKPVTLDYVRLNIQARRPAT